MILLRLIELALSFVVLGLIVGQVIIPLSNGTKLFPMFRKSTNLLEDKIRETQEHLHEQQLEDILKSLQSQLHHPDSSPNSTDSEQK